MRRVNFRLMSAAADPAQEIAELRALLTQREAELAVARAERKRCLGGTFRSARGRVMFEADARASGHVDFRA